MRWDKIVLAPGGRWWMRARILGVLVLATVAVAPGGIVHLSAAPMEGSTPRSSRSTDVLPWLRLYAVGLHAGTPIALVDVCGEARLVRPGDKIRPKAAQKFFVVVSIDPDLKFLELRNSGQTLRIDREPMQ